MKLGLILEGRPANVPDAYLMERQHRALIMVHGGLGRLRTLIQEGRYDELDRQCINMRKALGVYTSRVVETPDEDT